MARPRTMRAFRHAIREVEKEVAKLSAILKSKTAEVQKLKQDVDGLVLQRLPKS